MTERKKERKKVQGYWSSKLRKKRRGRRMNMGYKTKSKEEITEKRKKEEGRRKEGGNRNRRRRYGIKEAAEGKEEEERERQEGRKRKARNTVQALRAAGSVRKWKTVIMWQWSSTEQRTAVPRESSSDRSIHLLPHLTVTAAHRSPKHPPNWFACQTQWRVGC